MSNKTYTTAVVLIPPETVQPRLSKPSDRFMTETFRRWMPHITLLYPFAGRVKIHTTITPALAKAAQQMVTLFCSTRLVLMLFRHRKSCTMFLVPEPEDEILHAYMTHCMTHLPAYDDTARFAGGFHPHLSVGQFQHRSLNTEQATSPNRVETGPM